MLRLGIKMSDKTATCEVGKYVIISETCRNLMLPETIKFCWAQVFLARFAFKAFCKERRKRERTREANLYLTFR